MTSCCDPVVVKHKAGDTFAISVTVFEGADDDLTPVDLSGWGVQSQVRRSNGSLVSDLEAVIADPTAGIVEIKATATDTAKWPSGGEHLRCDIMLIEAPDEHITRSETFEIEVSAGVTKYAKP